MTNMNVDQVLNQMRVLSQQKVAPETAITEPSKFSTMLSDSINDVNSLQAQASELKTAYEVGDPNIDLPEVMIALQKASLSFEAVTEVRNKLLNAYQEVMNMQV